MLIIKHGCFFGVVELLILYENETYFLLMIDTTETIIVSAGYVKFSLMCLSKCLSLNLLDALTSYII